MMGMGRLFGRQGYGERGKERKEKGEEEEEEEKKKKWRRKKQRGENLEERGWG